MAPIREAVPPLFELVTPIPYVALQQMFNESCAWGPLGYEKALYLDELSDAAIEVIGEHVPKKSSPLSFCPTFVLTGAYRSVRRRRHGLRRQPHRGAMSSTSKLPRPTAHCTRPSATWVRNFWEAMRPHATGRRLRELHGRGRRGPRARLRTATAKYERLARIKAEYDPGNVFHLNANIKPSPHKRRDRSAECDGWRVRCLERQVTALGGGFNRSTQRFG